MKEVPKLKKPLSKDELMQEMLKLHLYKMCLELIDSIFDPQEGNLNRSPSDPNYSAYANLDVVLLGFSAQYFFRLASLTQIKRDEFNKFIEKNIIDLGLNHPDYAKEAKTHRECANNIRRIFEGDASALNEQFNANQLGGAPGSIEVRRLLSPAFNVLASTFKAEYEESKTTNFKQSLKTTVKEHLREKIREKLDPYINV